ncbi:hypothetical protein V7S43_011535 [Phytophthora oleae]|uniref:Uncharacterized protein n=1 Tax=Phytophthora oleae TaxID=2107226 RepID=A0ABD3F8D9_9STRA
MWEIASSPENLWSNKGHWKRRQKTESYVRQERPFKVRIGELEALLSDSRAKKSKENTLDASVDRVRAMHQSIMEKVSTKCRTVPAKFCKAKKQLETEVEWTKELAGRLDRLNQSLTRENQRLKTQFSTQENDREFLVKQLVTVKKDNVSLRAEIDTLRQQLDQLRDSGQPQQQLHSQSPTLLTSSLTCLLNA